MNLKQILPKVVASVVSAYMIVGNATIAGIGLGEVIAADTQAPAVAITTEVQKYIQYDKEGNKGAIVQEKISLAEQCDENTYLPTKRVTIQETVPVINGVLPSRVSIMGASVSLTKGSGQISQSYQADTGLFNIAYENQAPEENYQEHATDEFEIVYIYPEDAYLGNQEKCEIVQQVRANVTYQAKNQELSIEKTEGFKTAQTSNVGEIVNNQIIDVTKVYKGFLYTNERNKTNYETEYKTKSKLSVANKDVVDNIKIELAPSKYIYTDNKEEKELDTDTIQYHDTKITESDFQKLFGIEGYIDFYLENDKYATIRYADADKDGNRSFATYYYGEAPQGAEAGKVIYPENTKAVTMVTGKPQTEGNAYIETSKTMKATQNYGVAVENLKAIKEEITTQAIKNKTVEQEKKNDNGEIIFDEQGNPVKEQVTKEVTMSSNKNIGTIQLREPETQMSFEVSNQNLSTLAANQTTFTVKLDDTNSSCALLTAGTMKITLPKNLTNVKIAGAQMLYGNGLKIKDNVTIENGVISIQFAGGQKAYDVNNVNGGVNIVINLENITFAATTPTHTETLQASYANKTAEVKMNIVSKAGLLMVDKIETSEGAVATSIDSAEKNVSLAMNKKGQRIEKTLHLVNNYDKELSSITMIGNIGNKSEEEKANIAASLTETIKVAGGKADIYYSKTGNENDWSTQATKQTTRYKIVFKEALKPATTATITLKIAVPDNLSYDIVTYLNERVTYHYGEATLAQADSTKFNTAQQPYMLQTQMKAPTKLATTQVSNTQSVEATVQTMAGTTEVESGDEVFEGQVLLSKVTLKNNTSSIATYKLRTTLENAVYYELRKTYEFHYGGEEARDAYKYGQAEEGDVTREVTIKVPANSSTTYEYQYVISDNVESASNTIVVLDSNGNKALDDIKIEHKIKEAKLRLLTSYTFNEESEATKQLSTMLYVVNYQEQEIENLTIKLNLSKQLSVKSWEGPDNSNISVDYNKNDNTAVVHIDKINANELFAVNVLYDVATSDANAIDQVEIVTVDASCEYQGDTYLANHFVKEVTVNKINLTVDLMHNVTKEYVVAGDTVQYTVTITNNGVETANDVSIYFKPYGGFTPVSAQLLQADGSKKTITVEEGDSISENAVVPGKSTIKLIYQLKADYVEEEMTSEISLLDDHWNQISKTSTLKGKVNSSGNDEQEKNSIAGMAWLDSDKDGQRDDDEKLLQDITATLINADTGAIAKDSDGNNITTKTNDQGRYQFREVANGTYMVMFEFDTNKYNVTAYHKKNVNNNKNSDAIMNNVKMNGETKKVGITDKLKMKDNAISNIDIGLVEVTNFDLSVTKQIKSVTINSPKGTKTKEYKNKNFVKVDVSPKYMNSTNLTITYKFIIKNEGDVPGYVNRVVDDLPKALTFDTSLNKEWHKDSNGKLYTNSLSESIIQPGESREVELVLTKKMTENAAGAITNNVELKEMSNVQAIQDKEKGNNTSSADLVISIATGSAVTYIGIVLGSIAVIAAGTYLIKKKVTEKV